MKLGMPEVLKVPYKCCCFSAWWPRIPTGINVFQCINLFQNGQSLLLLWHNNKLVMYHPELSRIAGFCTNSNKNFLWGTPRPPCWSLYYNHNTANYLKTLKHTYPTISHPTFFWQTQDQMVSLCLIWKVHCWSFFANGCLKEQSFLKMYLKSPWKVLEKVMSWSVGTMVYYDL